jgi:hypothetical protein
MIVEKQMECRLAGETEVLGENLSQRHFCPSQNPTWPDPDFNPGRSGEKPATNRLSYGAARYALGDRILNFHCCGNLDSTILNLLLNNTLRDIFIILFDLYKGGFNKQEDLLSLKYLSIN